MTPAVLDPPAPVAAPRRERELENGESLFAADFLRRYERSPIKKAELIEGQVIMPSPVSAQQHAGPDALIQGWLFTYAARHPEAEHFTNPTVRLDRENVPQPDAVLIRLPEHGGRARFDESGYLTGCPELVVEIAASSASIDLHGKLRAYRRNGVSEYLVWRTLDEAVDWFVLENDDYVRLEPDAAGVLTSREFPGLRLPVAAFLTAERGALIA